YHEFTGQWIGAMNKYVLAREAVDHVKSQAYTNIFGPNVERNFREAESAGVYFHEIVAKEYRDQVTSFKAHERKFVQRERAISDYFREKSSQELARRSNELGEINLKIADAQRDAITLSNKVLDEINKSTKSTEESAQSTKESAQSTKESAQSTKEST